MYTIHIYNNINIFVGNWLITQSVTQKQTASMAQVALSTFRDILTLAGCKIKIDITYNEKHADSKNIPHTLRQYSLPLFVG